MSAVNGLTPISSIVELHGRWKLCMKGSEDLLDPLDRCTCPDHRADLRARRDRFEMDARSLVAEILARQPRSFEDLAVFADLALVYDAEIPAGGSDGFSNPGAFGTCTHTIRLALALQKLAPHVQFWFVEQDMTPPQRAELQAIAA